MKLAVSNIAWEQDDEAAVLEALRRHGTSGVEVAPSKIWPEWEGATPAAATAQAARYADLGFSVPALQAILFGKPDLQVFGDGASRAALLDHLEFVSELAGSFGAKVLVFGSPRNRDPGDMPAHEAFERGADFFRAAAERAHAHGTIIGLEPNPRTYACRFLTSWRDVKRMVEAVGHDALGTHLDVACIKLEDDEPAEAVRECGEAIAHFHITEPDLGGFSEPSMPHAEVAIALREVQYDRWLSVEMRPAPDPVSAVDTALQFVTRHYG
ncbi:sugar phosphate isomerase/epimerase family protein [Parvularcula lutaonensis]|uniref:Sugar phosphate isomerase/epimerase family protein n=1 Tax=Parvularcula lutaonensis TaxID=491923 RepID=A0ABV7MDU4_9PROT|nr:sugar phosphate isomerase/epimerase [Parvularcula lutaonensis]GGY49429.1 hypothetical protein GCM10007148_17440 [Parvularcula lutaonensis]